MRDVAGACLRKLVGIKINHEFEIANKYRGPLNFGRVVGTLRGKRLESREPRQRDTSDPLLEKRNLKKSNSDTRLGEGVWGREEFDRRRKRESRRTRVKGASRNLPNTALDRAWAEIGEFR